MQGITVRVDEGTLPVEATTDQAGFYTLTKSPGSYSIHVFASLSNTSPDVSTPVLI